MLTGGRDSQRARQCKLRLVFGKRREAPHDRAAHLAAMLCLAPASLPISFDDAMTLAIREMQRRGLAETHHVAALHGTPDATAEGAMFAATIFPHANAPRWCDRRTRLKFLIERDGRVSVRSWRGRSAAVPIP